MQGKIAESRSESKKQQNKVMQNAERELTA